MPKGNQRASLIPYHLRSFLGGQSDYEDKGIAGSFKASYNLDIRKQKDTLTAGQALRDDLALGAQDINGESMTDHAYFVVPSSDGNTYFFCHDGKIFRRNSSGVYLEVFRDSSEAGAIIGAAEWYSSAGWTYLLWATPTRLNIKKLSGPAYANVEPWNDTNTANTGTWPKTNLTSTSWHTMAMANGALMICNGNVMALVGYDLSYTNNALALIPGNSGRCIVERSKYGIVGCTRSDSKDESSFFSWDGIGLSWNDKQILKFGGLNSMIDTEIALAQIGTNGQLYISDFNTPVPFRQIRGGGQSDPDGIAAYHGMALIGIYNNTNNLHGVLGNGVYSVGRVNKNAPLVLNLEYQLTCDEITSVKVVGSDILIAYKLGNQYGVKIVDTANKANAVYQSLDLIAPLGIRRYPIPLGRLLEWSKVDLQCAPLPTGCKIEVWYKTDKATTGGTNSDGWYQGNMDLGSTASGLQFQDAGKQNAVFYVGQRGRVVETMLKLFSSGNNSPEVNEVNFYFSVG
jgi:hypothetical protein